MKKHLALAALALSAALTTGCSEFASLNEFVSADEAVMDRALLGVWTSEDATFVITPDANAYVIRYFDKGSTSAKFQARMVQIADTKLLDVVQDTDEAFAIPVHMLVRVAINGTSLSWSFVDSDAIKEEAARRFSVHKSDKRTIILASGDEWRKAIWKLAADEKTTAKSEIATRVQ